MKRNVIVISLLLVLLAGSISIIYSNYSIGKDLDNLLVLAIEKYYDGVPFIYTYDLDTCKLTKITKLTGYKPVWTKGKKKIVFSDDREYDPSVLGSPSSYSDIYVINGDGTEEKRLTDNKVSEDNSNKVAIFSMKLDGSNKTRIMDSQFDLTLDISPDGTEIVFDTDNGIYKYNIKESSTKQLIEAEEVGIYYSRVPNGHLMVKRLFL